MIKACQSFVGFIPIYLQLIFAILQFEILSLMNWIFLPAVACKTQVWNRLKIHFIKLNISNWRIVNIKFRWIGAEIQLNILLQWHCLKLSLFCLYSYWSSNKLYFWIPFWILYQNRNILLYSCCNSELQIHQPWHWWEVF